MACSCGTGALGGSSGNDVSLEVRWVVCREIQANQVNSAQHDEDPPIPSGPS